MWRQDDIFVSLDAPTRNRLPEEPDYEALRAKVVKPGPVAIPAAPLMHGTGAFNAMSILMAAGSIVTLEGRSFDAVELLDTVQRDRVNSLSIVGDAFAKPILRALDAEPDRWDVSSLRVIVSSGVMWSQETKEGLLAPQPAADHDRLARVVRGDRHGPVDDHRRRLVADGHVPPQRLHPRGRRRRARRGARHRRAGPGGAARPDAARLLQGPGEVGGDVRGHRRRPLLDPGRLRRGRRRRHRAPPRPGFRLHQHRRREGLPRRGRRGAEAAPRRGRRRGRGRARRALRRGHHGHGGAAAGGLGGRSRADRPRQGPPRRASRPRSGCCRSPRSAGRRTARSTTAGSRPRPSTA